MPTRRTFLETAATAFWAPHFTRVLGATGGGFDFLPPETIGSTTPPIPPFPVHDYHVHLSNTLTIDQALQLGKERGVQLGILEHPGPGFPINTDADLQRYIDGLRPYPVRIGLQPVYPGWSKAFSKPVLERLDYILMDALTLPKPDGGWLAIWQIDAMVDDGEAFMARYLQFVEHLLTTEP